MSSKGNYRARWHDYRQKGLYHITLLKAPATPAFGLLSGSHTLPVGTPGSSFIIATPVGKAIKLALREIPSIHPAIRLYQYALMPDHLHMLIRVEAEMDEILGRKIAIFKTITDKNANIEQVFTKGFNDQILSSSRNLNDVYRYLRENPYRLAVKRANPGFFRTRNNIVIGGIPCQAYGNIHLLANPFKEQVIVHRADTPARFAHNKERWLYTAASGGVAVSPFISPREKEVRAGVEEVDGRIILIANHPFGEREKPSGHDFDLCAQGRMLIISPQEPIDLSRTACLTMNNIARQISCPGTE